MITNVSHVRTHLECPTKGYYIHKLRRVRRRGLNIAAEVGICWHKAMETYLRTKDKPAAIEAVREYLLDVAGRANVQDLREVVEGWVNLKYAFEEWESKDDWEVIEVEKTLAASLPGGSQFVGTLDCVVKWNGQYWHLQHKTVHASKSLPAYWGYMQRDWHECAYAKMAELNGLYQPWGGTILNIVKKLSTRTMLAEPGRSISIQYITIPQHVIDKAWADLTKIVVEMGEEYFTATLKKSASSLRQNRNMCAGSIGNVLCPYIDVCNDVLSIDDDTEFQTEEDRYANRLIHITEVL